MFGFFGQNMAQSANDKTGLLGGHAKGPYRSCRNYFSAGLAAIADQDERGRGDCMSRQQARDLLQQEMLPYWL